MPQTNCYPNILLTIDCAIVPEMTILAFPVSLSDYANLINSLIDIFYLDKDTKWFLLAKDLANEMIHFFYDGIFFYDTPQDQSLIIRPKTVEDNVMPSGSSAAIMGLVRLNLINQDNEFIKIIQKSFK